MLSYFHFSKLLCSSNRIWDHLMYPRAPCVMTDSLLSCASSVVFFSELCVHELISSCFSQRRPCRAYISGCTYANGSGIWESSGTFRLFLDSVHFKSYHRINLGTWWESGFE